MQFLTVCISFVQQRSSNEQPESGWFTRKCCRKNESQNVMHLFVRKLTTATLFVENASKHYCVTNEIMKRWFLFDIVLLLVGFVFYYIKTSIFLSIFYCFYMGFTGLGKK